MQNLHHILALLHYDGALEHDYPGDPKPSQSPLAETLKVDYRRLFPSQRPFLYGQSDYELHGDDWEIDQELAEYLVSAAGSGYGFGGPPEWDIWAWYQPIHFYGPNWGIFITQDGLIECAHRIAESAPPVHPVHPGQSQSFAKATLRAAFAVLFLHQQYHHKTESAAIRMQVVEQRSIYPSYHRLVYLSAKAAHGSLEEGLASADSWLRITERAHHKWIGNVISQATRDYLTQSFPNDPPGYCEAQYLCHRVPFKDAENYLLASVQEAQLPPKRPNPGDFDVAAPLNKNLFPLAQHIWTLIPPGARPILPTHP